MSGIQHTFYLTKNEQTFKLQEVIDNLDGSKQIRVKNLAFTVGYFNITKTSEITWEKEIDGQPAYTNGRPRDNKQPGERSQPQTMPLELTPEIMNQFRLSMTTEEIEESREEVLTRIIRQMFDGYDTGNLNEVEIKIQQEIQVLRQRKQTLELARGRLDDQLQNEVNYVIHLLIKKIEYIIEGELLAADLLRYGYNNDNQEKTENMRLPQIKNSLAVLGHKEPIVNALHPVSEVTALPEGKSGSIVILPGFYGIDWFESLINAIPGVSFKVYRESKTVTLRVTDINLNLRLNREVSNLLNLPKGRLIPNVIYKGDYDINPFNITFIHCEQLNTSDNFYNGFPSNVLSFYHTSQTSQTHVGKTLKNGKIDKLVFSIKNEEGKIINNKGAGILIECEII